MNLQQIRRERDALVKLHEINRAMSTERNLKKLLTLIVDHALSLTRAERGFLILGRGSGTMEIASARNIAKNTIDHPQFKVSRGIIDECWRTMQPVLLEDAKEDTQFRKHDSVAVLLLASVCSVPLKRNSQMIGALYLDNRYRRGLFDSSCVLILETFADEAAVAIENAKLWETVEKQRRELEVMNLACREVNGKLKARVRSHETKIRTLESRLKIAPPKWD